MTRVRDSFLPIDFSANSTPQMILKIVLVVSITLLINVLQYATKTYLTHDPNLNQWNWLHGRIGAEKKVIVQDMSS